MIPCFMYVFIKERMTRIKEKILMYIYIFYFIFCFLAFFVTKIIVNSKLLPELKEHMSNKYKCIFKIKSKF